MTRRVAGAACIAVAGLAFGVCLTFTMLAALLADSDAEVGVIDLEYAEDDVVA